jgi:hypothetical protein
LRVRVPVLSVQISFAPPIVSDASNFLTRLFSYFIFITEKAREIVTASGSPSGTATTMTVIPIIKKLTRDDRVSTVIRDLSPAITLLTTRLMVIATKVSTAT